MHMTKYKPLISIIVAMGNNRAIGKDNQLLWHISNDLKRFKAITSGHTVVMGRLTFESLPNGPLPKRRNIVLSSNKRQIDGCEMAHSIDEVIELTKSEDEIFIIGGGNVYRQFLPLAHRLYITRIDKAFDADTFFSEIDDNQWELKEKNLVDNDLQNDFVYTFENYNRKA
jgi:dihydrofolate reductase